MGYWLNTASVLALGHSSLAARLPSALSICLR
jgi:4-amino-4-deoxy-L-arabinose transferase-like glycosyltransferase